MQILLVLMHIDLAAYAILEFTHFDNFNAMQKREYLMLVNIQKDTVENVLYK